MENATKKITDKLMIVRVSFHQWYPTKVDKRAMAKVAKAERIDPERAGRVLKNLVDLETIRPLQQRMRKLRDVIYAMTVPWDDGGNRALPAELYFDFCEEVREGIESIDKLADEYAVEYENQRTVVAKSELKGLFNEDDYPPAHVMRERFSVDYDFKPIMNPDDCRVWDLSDDAIKAIETKVRADVMEQVEQAQWHVVKQVFERAQEFIEKVRNYSDKVNAGEKRPRLYDTALTNLRDIMELVLTGLNFKSDPELTKMVKDLQKSLKKVNVGTLKNSDTVREESTAAIEKVLKKFEGVY